jgi:hypothetical protein
MSNLSLETTDASRAFEPGASIEVDAEWELDAQPRAVELRVVWNTRGRGTQDFRVVDALSLDASQCERKRIPLTLPRGPYSFVGQCVSLDWALELVALPSKDSTRLTITIGPRAKAVHITSFRESVSSDKIFDWIFNRRPVRWW